MSEAVSGIVAAASIRAVTAAIFGRRLEEMYRWKTIVRSWPWLIALAVLAFVAVLSYSIPRGIDLPVAPLVLIAVYDAGLRWKRRALPWVLLLCLLNLFMNAGLPGLGAVWEIPALLIAWRLGAEPEAISPVLGFDRIGAAGATLILAMLLLPSQRFMGFGERLTLDFASLRLLGPLLAAILGASRVHWARPAALLAVGVCAFWVLAPLRPADAWAKFAQLQWGTSPAGALTLAAAFAVGRVVRRGAEPVEIQVVARQFIAVAAAWSLAMFALMHGIILHVGFGPFGTAARGLLFGAQDAPRLEPPEFELASWPLLVALTLLGRRATGRLGDHYRRGVIAFAVMVFSLGYLMIPMMRGSSSISTWLEGTLPLQGTGSSALVQLAPLGFNSGWGLIHAINAAIPVLIAMLIPLPHRESVSPPASRGTATGGPWGPVGAALGPFWRVLIIGQTALAALLCLYLAAIPRPPGIARIAQAFDVPAYLPRTDPSKADSVGEAAEAIVKDNPELFPSAPAPTPPAETANRYAN